MTEAAIDQRVAEEIRAQLARQRRSQQWLADQTGIGRPGLSKRLSGSRSFSLAQLVVVAAALEVPITSLIEPVAA